MNLFDILEELDIQVNNFLKLLLFEIVKKKNKDLDFFSFYLCNKNLKYCKSNYIYVKFHQNNCLLIKD